MPSTIIFATNNEGRVYALSTGSSAWREFLYLGLEFKKVSAIPHFMWAIGGDRQVYVHVHGNVLHILYLVIQFYLKNQLHCRT